MTMQPLLIELGTEELPVKALPGLAQAFFDGILAGLEKRGVAFERGDAKPLFTPRRLAVLLPAVASEQPEQHAEVLGPYVNIALDADGQPTRALQGFAAKNGIEWTELVRTSDAKGERFVYRATSAGAQTSGLLPEILHEAVAAMPIPKPMRWGDHDYGFARPLHWLVMLLGESVVEAQLFGIHSGRESQGHRFHHAGKLPIAGPEKYQATLQEAFVLVDPDLRRAQIREQVTAAAKTVGGLARITDDNLEQVVALTEWPVPVTCSFDHDFLAVPQEALIETMESNQKFFPVLTSAGALTEHFIGIANIESSDPEKIRTGYERVIRPRFADAKFFLDEDLKQGLVAMGDGLSSVTYQARLGSITDKVMRVATLAEQVAAQVGADPMQARRAAQLSKNDLQSRMVNEFPELQGITGRHYATVAGEPAAVALAIEEVYQPRHSGDPIAASLLGKVLAIAERADTLAGGFSVGLKPTGSKDAFALRRAALSLARTIIESRIELDLSLLLDAAAQAVHADVSRHGAGVLQGAAPGSHFTTALAAELYDFILDRLRSYYTDKGVPATHFNAVAELKPVSLYDFDRRIDAVGQFAALPEAEALAAANKRSGNILRKVGGTVPDAIDPTALVEPAEKRLAETLAAVESSAGLALSQGDYVNALCQLAQLREPVDSFFDEVMVMSDDARLRDNRLALLQRISAQFLAVADVSRLAVGN